MKQNVCKYCGSHDHYSLMCFMRPRVVPKKVSKSIKKFGKQGVKWMETRNEWLQRNPADHEGYWYCYLCGLALTIDTLTLDHKKSRSRHPELRYEQDNLAPCCSACQVWKGSRDFISTI